jgi:hypothetical protein
MRRRADGGLKTCLSHSVPMFLESVTPDQVKHADLEFGSGVQIVSPPPDENLISELALVGSLKVMASRSPVVVI